MPLKRDYEYVLAVASSSGIDEDRAPRFRSRKSARAAAEKMATSRQEDVIIWRRDLQMDLMGPDVKVWRVSEKVKAKRGRRKLG